MSRTSDLIDHIEDVIYQNDTQDITGAIMQESLLSMVGVLGYPLADWANYTNDTYEKERPLSAYLGKQMNDRIAQLTQLYVIVSVLPTASAQTLGKIYLVPAEDAETGNYYEEYITIQRSGAYMWELVGSTKIDLSGYQTKITVDNPLAFSLISGFQSLTIGSKVFNGSTALTITKSDLGLGDVENTALSTWTGSANISTLGTITTGAWRGTEIQDTYIASADDWNAKYDKPAAGIPKEHLTTTLQTTLTHADTLWNVIGIDENGDVYIKKKSDNSVRNFYAFGDITAGGAGTSPTPPSGGITAIKIGTTEYKPSEGSTIVTLPVLTDAPIDNKQYARYNGTWTEVAAGGVTSVISLTGDITQSQLRTALGLGSLAYKSSLAATDIPSLSWSKITSDKPTTLAGYEISDAKIQNGVIILGSNSITPLTSVKTINSVSLVGSGNITLATLGVQPTISNLSTIESNAANGQTAYGWGNHANAGYASASSLANYLPLSGGLITAPSTPVYGSEDFLPLTINTPSMGDWGGIRFINGGLSREMGALGFSAIGNPAARISGTWRTLYHSGNCNNASTPWSCSNLTASTSVSAPSLNGCINYMTSNNAYINTPGWYRFFVRSGLHNGNGVSLKCSIGHGYSNSWTERYDIEIVISYAGDVSITQIAGTNHGNGQQLITKVRVDYVNEGYFAVDFYTIASVGNTYWVWGDGVGLYQVPSLVSSPSGATVEFGLISGMKTNGNFVASGDVTAGSDARWKHNIESITDWSALLRLNPCTWQWNSDNHKGSGLIAQEVREVLPHLVKEDGEGFLHLNYDGLHAYTIKAIQSHEERISALEKENEELKMEIQRLRS